MKKVFKHYSEHVLEIYQQQKDDSTLSLRLANPSPANIRDECLAVCRARYSEKDSGLLKGFFGENADKETYLEVIENFDINKFRPLRKFIIGQTEDPDPLIIELLAWLLDIQPRPSSRWIEAANSLEPETKVITPEPGKTVITPPGIDDNTFNPPPTGENEDATPPTSGKPYLILTIILVIALIVTGAGIWVEKNRTPQYPKNNLIGQKCMYWTGDHYEPISCNQHLGDTLVVALDSARLAQFKRITKPDTLTKKDIGKVWYIKLNGRLEYYTAGGLHPIDPQRRLRPISETIIENHILRKQE